jgi:hypothetical protein
MDRSAAIDNVVRIQELRAREYHRLEASMRTDDTAGVQRSTRVFRDLSEGVRDIIRQFETVDGEKSLVATLKTMQRYEAEKLRLTVEIRSLKSSGLQDEEDAGVGEEPPCGCRGERGPSPHEVREALKEGIASMERCVQNILECMEDLQYMRE